MKAAVQSLIASVCILLPLSTSFAQSSGSREEVPIEVLIVDVAKRTGKRFIVDPRVRANVMIVQKGSESLSYGDLLSVLHVHGFTAVEEERFVRIVPDASVRQLALPLLRGNDKRLDAEYVTKLIPVKTMPAAMLVPLLRPMLPVQAHLAASICSNDLVIVDTFANVKRIESLVQSLDKGQSYEPRDCVALEQGEGEPKR